MLHPITVTEQAPSAEGSSLLNRAHALAQALIEIVHHSQAVPYGLGFVLAALPDGQDHYFQHAGDSSRVDDILTQLEMAGASSLIVVAAAYMKLAGLDKTTEDAPCLSLHLTEPGGVNLLDYARIVPTESGFTVGDIISVNPGCKLVMPYRPVFLRGHELRVPSHRLH